MLLVSIQSGLPGYHSQGCYASLLGAFQTKHLFIHLILNAIPSPYLTLQTRTLF